MDVLAFFAFLIAIIALALIIVIYVIYFRHQGSVSIHGISFVIQVGAGGSAKTDTMKTGDNILYIGAPDTNLTLSIASDSSNKIGRVIGVKNNSSKDAIISLTGGTGLTIDAGGLGNKVKKGQTALLCATSNNNEFIRLV